jgi:hypothetical protein
VGKGSSLLSLVRERGLRALRRELAEVGPLQLLERDALEPLRALGWTSRMRSLPSALFGRRERSWVGEEDGEWVEVGEVELLYKDMRDSERREKGALYLASISSAEGCGGGGIMGEGVDFGRADFE